ncbi:MAG: Uma2 family endonuclease [Myxococcaceae bacterium]
MLQQDAQGYRLPYRVRYPVELHPPPGFKVDDGTTWPQLDGRLEFIEGRLLYMPPCGDVQQDVTMDVAYLLKSWSRAHSDFVIGGNEAGMVLGGETRAADVAVWKKSELGAHTGGFRRVAPVLAVEVAGQDEGEVDLRTKARWYLEHGASLVWIVLPASREVIVLASQLESRCSMGQKLPEHSALPELTPQVREFFTELE